MGLLWSNNKMFYIFMKVNEWMESSIFIYPLLLSLLSALIFYYFFSVLPQKRQKRNIKDHVIFLTERILFHVFVMVRDSVNSKELDYGNLTEKELNKAMKGVFMDDKLKHFRSNKKGVNMEVGETIVDSVQDIQELSNELFRYLVFLDTSLVKYINEVLRNTINESFVNSYNSTPIFIGNQVFTSVRRDISIYSSSFYELYELHNKIQGWLFKKHGNHKSVIRKKTTYYMYTKKDYKKGLKFAKALYRFTEHKKNSCIYIVRCLAGLGKWDNAKKKMEKFIMKKIINKKEMEDYFKHDSSFKKVNIEKLFDS